MCVVLSQETSLKHNWILNFSQKLQSLYWKEGSLSMLVIMYSSIFLQWASKIFLLVFNCNYQNFRFEWHPFTISSAPEKRDVFSVHIRAAGGWTNALYNYVQGENNKWSKIIRSTIERNKVAPDQAWYQKNLIEPTKLKVFIDGPHSAPSSTIFSSEHAVLVATGIGVTPFASILQSIVAKYENIGFFY